MKTRRLWAIALAILIIASCLTAFARASDQLASYNVTVSAQGSGKVRVSASVGGTHSSMIEIGFPTIALYEKNGSGNWTCVEVINSEYNYSAGSHGYRFTYQGVAGRQYYAYASYYAKDSVGADARNSTSITITAN